MGPGPVDAFSVRFEEMFQPFAYGYVCGREVNREELKETLLGLRARWDPEEATATGTIAHPTHVNSFHVSLHIIDLCGAYD